jgi:hypothetical protein
MRVRIHIERLVLDGFTLTAAQSRQVQATVERELLRLVATSGASTGNVVDSKGNGTARIAEAVRSLPQRCGAIPSATAGTFIPPPHSSPVQLGRHIGGSVYGGIRNTR